VPSTAACRDGSASTANTVSADALIVVVALTFSSVMVADLRSTHGLRGELLSCPRWRRRGEAGLIVSIALEAVEKLSQHCRL
jgi:hypothetical protein